MGSLVGPVADEIAEQVQEAGTVSFYGIPYQAASASASTVLDGDYFDSKEEGSELLELYLDEEIAACPTTKLVVIGYSQGAHAAGDLLAEEPSSITNHIAAFVMFGDPRFNPEASYAMGTFDLRDHGLAGARSLSDFSTWHTRVFSFCSQNDLVCQGFGIHHSSAAHDQSQYVANYGTLVAGLVRRKLGYPRPAGQFTPLDLAFVIDSTGSMGSSIDGVKEAAARIASTLKSQGADFRVGLVDYKDVDQGDPYAARVDLPMTSNVTSFKSALTTISADGGGDTPEAVYSGLMTAIQDLSWRSVPRKAIIVMGDAPAKDPEPITGYTHQSVVSAAHNLDPAVIDPVAIGSGPAESFEVLADGSGGKLFTASNPGEVSDQVVTAVDDAALPIYTNLTVSTPARPGEPVFFSAASSYYDAGEITSYSWDFDGDGISDETTTLPKASHIYNAPFSGIASVTLHTSDGHERSATAPVVVTSAAPTKAGPPRGLTVAPKEHSLNVSWESPDSLGGSVLAGYVVSIDRSDEVPVRVIPLEQPEANNLVVPELSIGTYHIRVAAVTEYGTGGEAEVDAKIAGPEHLLTVSVGGSGSGIITGSGIHCPGNCVASFEAGMSISLTATPVQGSAFTQWGGDCSGSANCTVDLAEERHVSAVFDAIRQQAPQVEVMPSPSKCRKGFRKRRVRGKARCVKIHRRHNHHKKKRVR